MPILTYRLTLNEDTAQTLLDVISFGVAGHAKSRAGLLQDVALSLIGEGMAPSRQDFTGRIDFDTQGEPFGPRLES